MKSLPNVTFEDHLYIQLGGKRVELYHYGRAHTNGDVVVYFPATRTLRRAISLCSAMRHPN